MVDFYTVDMDMGMVDMEDSDMVDMDMVNMDMLDMDMLDMGIVDMNIVDMDMLDMDILFTPYSEKITPSYISRGSSDDYILSLFFQIVDFSTETTFLVF